MLLEVMIVLVVVALDMAVKTYVSRWLLTLPDRTFKLIPDIFHLTYVENRGAAFGMLENARWFFIVLTVLACGAIAVFLVREHYRMHFLLRFSLALVFAGAVGNLIDRVMLGYVRDMFYLVCIDFPVFNVADCAVSIGGVLLVLDLLFFKGKTYLNEFEAILTPKKTK